MTSLIQGAGVGTTVEAGEITDASVTTTKLADDAVTPAKIATDQYRLIHESVGFIGASATVNTYALVAGGSAGVFGTANTGAWAFYFDPTVWQATGKNVKLRLLVNGIVNATAPGASCTFQPGIYPVTAGGGGAGVILTTAGTVISGSNPAAQGPLSATTGYTWDSTDFAAPSAGLLQVGIVLAGATTAASSAVSFHARLLVRLVT